MSLEKKLHEELQRYKEINNYTKKLVVEQDAPPPPPPVGGEPTDAAADTGGLDTPPPPPPSGGMDTPPSSLGETTPSDTEEIDITDLVNMTKSIKKDIEDNKQEHGTVLSQMDAVFSKLDDLEAKLGQMDSVIAKIDELGSKVQDMKPHTPQEKLELRSLDSYPFNQKPQEFFAQKQGEMQMTGKNEYVLTKDDVENYSKTITQTFNPELEKDEFKF
jgi:hypothetical protein